MVFPTPGSPQIIILDDAGIMAKCKAGFGEVEVYLANKIDKKKAIRAIEDEGYQVDWN